MSYSFSERNDYAKTSTLAFNPYEYCNGTPVNNQGIESMELFQVVSAKISREKMANRRHLRKSNLSIGFFREAHKFLFSSIYGWAGDFIDEDDPVKESDQDGEKKHSAKKAQLRLTLWLISHANEKAIPANKLAASLATDFISLYRVHPFYDGNIRTLLVFFERFCEANGWKLDMDYMLSLLDKPQDGLSLKETLNAKNAHFLLEDIFKKAITIPASIAKASRPAIAGYMA
jgi:fido (protein-threonine AMPylation protein)